MEVRPGTRDDVAAIQAMVLRACTEDVGELVPSEVVTAEARRRYPTASLCEHILNRRLLVGVDEADRIQLVCMVDERDDHVELITILAPQHPAAREPSAIDLLRVVRALGWCGPVASDCVLGNLPHERFHETAGFSPGEVEALAFAGHAVYRRRWWLGPDDE